MNGFHDARNRPSSVSRVGTRSGGSVGAAIDQSQMDADAEGRSAPHAADGVRSGGSIGHEACACENAAVVRVEDAIVDTDGQPEVISIDSKDASHVQLLGLRKTWAVSAASA